VAVFFARSGWPVIFPFYSYHLADIFFLIHAYLDGLFTSNPSCISPSEGEKFLHGHILESASFTNDIQISETSPARCGIVFVLSDP
jgi:hypothetical protein